MTLIPKNFTLTLVAAILAAASLSACSTGIDSTEKIKLSKKDLKLQQPSQEELLLEDISPSPINKWKRGKRFIVLDERINVIFTPSNSSFNPQSDATIHQGDIITYQGFETTQAPNGFFNTILLFSVDGKTFSYNSGRKSDNNLSAAQIRSDELPMLLDEDILNAVAAKLKGLNLWTLSRLWFNPESGSNISGKKFAPVEIIDVMPGDKVFPLKLVFTPKDQNELYAMLMSLTHSGISSRSFDSLFSLSDPRLKYPKIDEDTWQNIQSGRLSAGMTKLECKLALGSPSSTDEKPGYSSVYDRWNYPGGVVLNFTDGILTSFRQ